MCQNFGFLQNWSKFRFFGFLVKVFHLLSKTQSQNYGLRSKYVKISVFEVKIGQNFDFWFFKVKIVQLLGKKTSQHASIKV